MSIGPESCKLERSLNGFARRLSISQWFQHDDKHLPSSIRPAREDPSVDDVDRKSKRSVEFGSCDLVEVPNGLGIEILDRHRDHVVAGDDAALGQSLLCPDLDFGADTSDGSRDRGARDRAQHSDGCVTSEDADRATSCGCTEINPEDVVACYHAGAVSAASRRADWMSAGSGG